MKAAGLFNEYYLAVGPDMAKDKAPQEQCNHYRNNPRKTVVTAEAVLAQVKEYDGPCTDAGHLYGAIIGALDQLREQKAGGKYARYPLGYAAHYLADLSMPLHNVEYNDFNRANHAANDGVVEGPAMEPLEGKVARIAAGIQFRMSQLPPYRLPSAAADPLAFRRALAEKIAEIATESVNLGYALQDATPPRPLMTQDEAFGRLARSAALLRAAYQALQQAPGTVP
jgi:hypothetical protein